MAPWVRYSMAAYFGFLLAGSIAAPMPRPTEGANPYGVPQQYWLGPVPEVTHEPPRSMLDWSALEPHESNEAPAPIEP